jgi:pimeloyl-ACP methyl ester carboxylesterase
MFDALKKLAYGARVLLSRSGETSLVDVSGRQTQVRHGGDGPPLVYLHSGIGETVWLPFLERWAKQFAVYAPAHPGFAKSEGIEQIDTIDDMVFHYAELFDTLGLEKINLGGISIGGWIATEFAVRWPERVSRLWLCGAPGLWLEDQPLMDLFRNFQDINATRNVLFYDPQSYQATLIIKEPEKLNEETRLAVYKSLSTLARLTWERPYSPKLAQRLYRIKCPTLVMSGDTDRLIPPAYAREYQRLIPGAKLHLFAKCGHLPMFEKESEFVQTVADFCKG